MWQESSDRSDFNSILSRLKVNHCTMVLAFVVFLTCHSFNCLSSLVDNHSRADVSSRRTSTTVLLTSINSSLFVRLFLSFFLSFFNVRERERKSDRWPSVHIDSLWVDYTTQKNPFSLFLSIAFFDTFGQWTRAARDMYSSILVHSVPASPSLSAAWEIRENDNWVRREKERDGSNRDDSKRAQQ